MRISRRGLRNCEQNPKSKRSAGRKFGARRRERRMTKSCRLRRRFSASTALVPRLLRRVVGPVSSRRISQSKYFMLNTLSRSTIKARKADQVLTAPRLRIRHAGERGFHLHPSGIGICVWSFRSIRELRIRKQINGPPQKLVSSGRARFQAHTFGEATLMKTKSQTAILDAAFGIDPFL